MTTTIILGRPLGLLDVRDIARAAARVDLEPAAMPFLDRIREGIPSGVLALPARQNRLHGSISDR